MHCLDAVHDVPEPETSTNWLTNPSFKPPPDPAETINSEAVSNTAQQQNTDVSHIQTETSTITSANLHKDLKHKPKHKEHRKKVKKSKHEAPKQENRIDEFTGNEDYYVDKIPVRGYLNVQTLHKPACPKYRIYARSLGHIRRGRKSTKLKRYYIKSKKDKIQCGDRQDTTANTVDRLDETEFVNKNKVFNRKLGGDPGDVPLWLEFVRHQDYTHMKSTKTQIVERKIDILEKALRENPSNEQLYRLYVEIIDQTYPSFEVSKILDRLLAKGKRRVHLYSFIRKKKMVLTDPTNYILWNSQILATQGSMARCIVPDVLKLYERCMKSMYNKNRYDEVMLSKIR